MKKFIILFLINIFIFSSCSDYLDVKPRGKDIATTIAHYDGLFNTTPLFSMTYLKASGLGSPSMAVTDIIANFLSDEWITDKAGLTVLQNYSNEPAVKAYKFDNDIYNETEYSAAWGCVYTHLYTYNVIANGVMSAEDGTDSEKKTILAEARVMRAYLHFLLAQFFAKPYNESTAATDLAIPIVTKADVSETSYKRSTVKELYDFVLKEMIEACPDLADKNVHPLRTYKAAGYAMLAKVYWMKSDYKNALAALNTSLDLLKGDSGVSLYDYNTMLPKWGYNSRAPFLFPVTSKYPSNIYQSSETVYTKQYILAYVALFALPGSLYIKPEFMSLYGSTDCRKAFFPSKSYKGVPYMNCRPMRVTANLGIGLPEIYLMSAECKARTNDLSGAKEDLYMLRKNRMPATDALVPSSVVSQNDLIRFVIDERKREFMGTGYRWIDIRRLWNDPLFQEDKSSYTHTDGDSVWTMTEKSLTFKIPPMVLKWNSSWEDND